MTRQKELFENILTAKVALSVYGKDREDDYRKHDIETEAGRTFPHLSVVRESKSPHIRVFEFTKGFNLDKVELIAYVRKSVSYETIGYAIVRFAEESEFEHRYAIIDISHGSHTGPFTASSPCKGAYPNWNQPGRVFWYDSKEEILVRVGKDPNGQTAAVGEWDRKLLSLLWGLVVKLQKQDLL